MEGLGWYSPACREAAARPVRFGGTHQDNGVAHPWKQHGNYITRVTHERGEAHAS